MCIGKADHHFPRRPDVHDCYANGFREIWGCNDCLAVKIMFTVDVLGKDEPVVTEKVIEPD